MCRALLALLALPALALAQGSLAPPGAPAATMKTLDQLEARTPLGVVGGSTATLSISQSGSYVLVGNVTVASGYGIHIDGTAQNVTLDLNGFTISSTAYPAAGTGIYLSTGSNFTIRNGHIRGDLMQDNGTTFTTRGFLNGIDALSMHNVRVEHVSVEGVAGYGISLHGGDGIISACSARYCGTTGLRANMVLDSIALKCGGTAIHAGTAADAGTPAVPVANGIASNCTGESLAGGQGIFATTATNCYGTSNSGWGLYAKDATNCHGLSATGTRGLHAEYSATGCYGEITTMSGGGSSCGLWASTASNCRGIIGGGAGAITDYVGLSADIAQNSYGSAGIGNGLRATTSALNCYGTSMFKDGIGLAVTAGTANSCGGASGSNFLGFGTALKAAVAIGCTTRGGTIDAPQKFLGTP